MANPTAFIRQIETLVPVNAYPQEYARDRMMQLIGDPQIARYVRRVYDRSGIATRYSVVGDFMPDATPELFHTGNDGRLIEPSTEERNRCFIRHSRHMSVEVAQRVVARTPGLCTADITHVITASCTGFYNPGPDLDIVIGLGLPESTERYHLGFMGCYAAFPALRMAQQFCAANPQAVVLIVCLELCSLHLQIRPDPDSLLANALFADGAAAAIVSTRSFTREQSTFALRQFLPALVAEGRSAMTWEIGDHGFNIFLSSYVPDIIGANIGAIAADLWGGAAIDCWAIHPGGRAILDKIEKELALKSEQLAASREVLRDYGNMSSATIWFVLQKLLREAKPGMVGAMAFGPGLTIETALLELVPAREACAIGS